VGGRGRRRDHRLSRQVAAQVAPRLMPVLDRVTAQFHPRMKLSSNSSTAYAILSF